MFKRIGLIILVSILTVNVFGEKWESNEIDSLISLAQDTPNNELDKLYSEIGWRCRINWPLLGIQYCTMAVELAKKYNHPETLVKAYVSAGTNERNLKHYEDALKYYELGLQVAKDYNIQSQIAYGYNNIGNIYIYMGQYEVAEDNLKIALSFGEGLNNDDVIAYAYQNLGQLYNFVGKLDIAIEFSHKAYNYWRKMQQPIGRQLVPLRNIALCYIKQGKYEEAKEIYYSHIDKPKLQSELQTMTEVWYRLTQIYYKQGRLDSAEFCSETSLMIAWQTDDYYNIKKNYSLMDSILIAQGRYKDAALLYQDLIRKNDSIFNNRVKQQDEEIKYTSKYYIKETEFKQVKAARKFRHIIILLSTVATILAALGFVVVLKRYQKVRALNQNLINDKKKILESLKYTATLQAAIMPKMEVFGKLFNNKFLIYKPKDIVCGDFFWRFDDKDYEMIAVADCTGHGVPGAMLTMLGVTELQDIALSGVRNAGEVLNLLREKVKKITQQNKQTEISDGMDITLVIIEKKTMRLDFAGAFNSLMYVRNGQINELKATRNPIGSYIRELPFESQYLQLENGDELYLMSDGYCSQFGGDDNSKFPKSKFRKILLDNSQLGMNLQGESLENELQKWQGKCEQVDDVTVAGFKVDIK